jgi:SpoVK/Ycf46/Vps4 family AAA+-type ATPase
MFLVFGGNVDISGADLHHLVRQAAQVALVKYRPTDGKGSKSSRDKIIVGMDCWEQAMNSTRPSVSEWQRQQYEKLRSHFDVVR